jgi:hypothetical protein
VDKELEQKKQNMGLLIVDKQDCLKNIEGLRRIIRGCTKEDLLDIISQHIQVSVWAGYLYLMNEQMDEDLYQIVMSNLKDEEYKNKLKEARDGRYTI